MDTNITGVGVGISDRFRSVVEEKEPRIAALAPKAQRLDVKVTQRNYSNGNAAEETVELTLSSKGPVIRAEARDADKFTALDLAIDKLTEQLRRAKDKRIDARKHPHGARFEKSTGSFAGVDVQPASVETMRAVATGTIPTLEAADEDAPYTPVVIREKQFDAEWMSVDEAVDRMELVGHPFFLFINAANDQPSVVYRRKGWDYGVISLATEAAPEAA